MTVGFLFLLIQEPSVSLESLLARSLCTVLQCSSIGAVLFECMDFVRFALVVLKYLSKPNNVVFL